MNTQVSYGQQKKITIYQPHHKQDVTQEQFLAE